MAIVTGGGRGIGRAVALRLAHEGADVAISYRANDEAAESAAEEVRATGTRGEVFRGNVGSEEDVRALVKKATGGRPVIAIDGCQLGCCEQVLAAKGVRPVRVVRLHELGLKKRRHVDFDEKECEAVFHRVLEALAPTLIEQDPSRRALIAAQLGG